MNVTNAFLHEDLHENIYMKFHLSYNGLGYKISQNTDLKPHATLVCKLKKSFYGLKQAPKN